MNKYEDIDMIEVENPEDIVDVFGVAIDGFDGTVALITDRELIVHALHELIHIDDTNITYVDLPDEYDEGQEYFVKVDAFGDITCGELDDYNWLRDVDVAYIDMDGTVNQDVIDYCVNDDMDVVLWGVEDEPLEDEKYDKVITLPDGQKVHVRNYLTEEDIKEINEDLNVMDLLDIMNAMRRLDRNVDLLSAFDRILRY